MNRAIATAAGVIVTVALIAVIGAASASTGAYRDAPPPGFSGGFGEPSCHACHFLEEPNAAPGSIVIRGVPDRYSPGASYPVTVIVTRPGIAAAGFQLTARHTDDGRQAGSLALPASEGEPRIAITASYDIAYAHHLRAGTILSAPDTAAWTVIWTAPATARAVSFHAAANAANGDDAVDGDFVYTATTQTAGSRSP